MRAAAALKAPSPVSLAELRSRRGGWEAKVHEIKGQQVELSALAEDGDAAAQANLGTLKVDLADAEDRLARVTAALVVAERRQAEAEAAATEEARAIRANALDAEVQAIATGGDGALADFREVVARLKASVPTVQVLALKAGLSMAVAENVLTRMRADMAFTLRGLIELPAPDTQPASPFARFADDTRADLARIGLAPPETPADG